MATRSSAEKLLGGLPKAAGRRAQSLSATRRVLIDAATEQFSANGYAGTSLDAIVSGARVTKGALYHHFSGKQAIFEAVFEKLENDAETTLRQALRRSKDPWVKASYAVRAYLKIVQDPAYQRVVIQDGPAVLGYERFRDQEQRPNYAQLGDLVRTLLSSPGLDVTDELADTFSRILFGAISAAGEAVTAAADPRAAVNQFEVAFSLVLDGIHALANGRNGSADADTEDLPPDSVEAE